MKTIFALVLLLASSSAWAAPNPADYTVNVHVVSSYLDNSGIQTINVLIDGKQYELGGAGIIISRPSFGARTLGLIVPGDYKARITLDKHKGTYAYARQYEVLFPDQTTGKFQVIGMTE